MNRVYLIAALCTGLAALVDGAPALALVTSATISVSPANYSGACPTTIAATATVTGSPGTAFKYAFYRNAKAVLPTIPGTIGASGSFTAHDAIPISSNISDFDQVWVTGLGKQSDVYSNKAAYSVACATSGSPGQRYKAKSNVPQGMTQTVTGHASAKLKIVTLQPAHESMLQRSYNGCTGVGNLENLDCENGLLQELYPANYVGPVGVGYRYWTEKNWYGDKHTNNLLRAAYYFNLPNLQHHLVTKATLVLARSDSFVYRDGQWDLPSSDHCADDFGVAQSDWWDTNVQWLDADFGETFGYAGTTLTANVAHDVSVWSAFGGNFGWIVKGADENLGAFTEQECISDYTATLTLQYF